LMARMASPLSGMATSDHSCSGDAPLGFGSTVTIFHPVVMHLRLTSSLVPAHPTTSTRRPISLPQLAALGGDLAKTALQQRPESAGRCALGIPRKADTSRWQASRAETGQPRPRPSAPASVAPRSHHGSTPGCTSIFTQERCFDIGGFKRRIESGPVFSTCDPKGSDCDGALVAVWCVPYSFGDLVQSGCNVVARNRHQIISRRDSRSQGPCRRWDRARNS
jgi:hypothetical protein